MKTEFEAKFVAIDLSSMRQRLKKIGAKRTRKMTTMRRVTIDSPDMKRRNALLRVRDEGNRITLTYKQFNNLTIDGAKEYEVTVSDFQTTIDLLKAAGLPHRSFQESRREIWAYDGAEIMLDEWPWLKPYIEIEGSSEAHVREVSAKLGFLHWQNAVFGDVMAVYRTQYPHLTDKDAVGNLPEVRFGDPPPVLLKP